MKMQVRAIERRLPLCHHLCLFIRIQKCLSGVVALAYSTVSELVKAERLSVGHTVLYSKTLFLNLKKKKWDRVGKPSLLQFL